MEKLLTQITVTLLTTFLYTAICAIFPSKSGFSWWNCFRKRIAPVSCVVVILNGLRTTLQLIQYMANSNGANLWGQVFLVLFVITPIRCLIYYNVLKLIFNYRNKVDKMLEPHVVADNAPIRTIAENTDNSTDKTKSSDSTDIHTKQEYRQLAKKILDVCSDFGDAYGEILRAMGQDQNFVEYIQMRTGAGTALYVYAMLKIQETNKAKFKSKQDFERDDTIMIETFAEVLQEPSVSLMKKMSFSETSKRHGNKWKLLVFN